MVKDNESVFLLFTLFEKWRNVILLGFIKYLCTGSMILQTYEVNNITWKYQECKVLDADISLFYVSFVDNDITDSYVIHMLFRVPVHGCLNYIWAVYALIQCWGLEHTYP